LKAFKHTERYGRCADNDWWQQELYTEWILLLRRTVRRLQKVDSQVGTGMKLRNYMTE